MDMWTFRVEVFVWVNGGSTAFGEGFEEFDQEPRSKPRLVLLFFRTTVCWGLARAMGSGMGGMGIGRGLVRAVVVGLVLLMVGIVVIVIGLVVILLMMVTMAPVTAMSIPGAVMNAAAVTGMGHFDKIPNHLDPVPKPTTTRTS